MRVKQVIGVRPKSWNLSSSSAMCPAAAASKAVADTRVEQVQPESQTSSPASAGGGCRQVAVNGLRQAVSVTLLGCRPQIKKHLAETGSGHPREPFD